jgi:hypothetical protein
MNVKTQDYKTHRRLVPGFHGLGYLLAFTVLGGGIAYACYDCPQHVIPGLLSTATGMSLLVLLWFSRSFALKAQDRAIRAEENFRHFILTGKPLDSRLRPSQIVALRFAPDAEFPALADRAAQEGLKNDAIKRLIQNWRGDFYRV